MAHPQQLQFIKSFSESLSEDFSERKILEIGSFDVNGSIQQFFDKSTYVGVDLTEGPGVDIVCEGHKIADPDESYDITVSCECFEHNPHWAETFLNMWRMTKGGGIVLFTCATTGRPEHGTTRSLPKHSPGTQSLNWDYYQNLTEEDFHQKFKLDDLFDSYFFIKNTRSCADLYFAGIRKSESHRKLFSIDLPDVKRRCEADQNELLKRKKREKFIPKPLRPYFRKIFEAKSKNSNLIG